MRTSKTVFTFLSLKNFVGGKRLLLAITCCIASGGHPALPGVPHFGLSVPLTARNFDASKRSSSLQNRFC